jgi:anti-sigma factor RsiW
MTEFDHTTLSAYLDGELDRTGMHEVEDYLDRNAEARHYVIGALHATVRLRASGRDALHEPLPDRLTAAIHKPPPAPGTARRPWWPTFRPALAFALLLLGVGLGLILRPAGSATPTGSFPALPAAYLQAVNESLENHRRGEAFVLQTAMPEQRIVVTPTRTYRNGQGQYFRDYRLEFFNGDKRRLFKGLAVRTGQHQWETTAIFYPQKTKRL